MQAAPHHSRRNVCFCRLHYAEGSLAPLLVFGLVMNHAGDAAPWGVSSLVYWVAGQIKKVQGCWLFCERSSLVAGLLQSFLST